MERKPFNEWLGRHARGTLNDDATAALAEVVQSVADIGKPGKVVLEVTIAPAGAGGRTVTLGGKILTKKPISSPELGVFYVGDGGSLHRDDPYQQSLEPVRAEAEQTDIRQVDKETGEIKQVPAEEA